MHPLIEILDQFDSILKTYNINAFNLLQPPLAKEKIYEYLKILRVNDENFEALFNWKNGFSQPDRQNTRYEIFDFGSPLSIESIIKVYQSDSTPWVKSFLPLVEPGTGDAMLFNNSKGKDYGKIHLYSVSLFFINEPISYYDSIYAMIVTTIEAYVKKILFYDDSLGRLNIDTESFHRIASTLNKKSDYWKL
jgi:hypothetical protein